MLQRAVAEQQERPPPPTWPHGDPPPADPIAAADDPIGSDPIDGPIEGPEGICGHLELRGFKHGVFVVLLRDTMLLYRSAEVGGGNYWGGGGNYGGGGGSYGGGNYGGWGINGH